MVQAQAAPQTPGNIVPVTAENFPPAESDLYFVAVVKKGGFGKFDHTRELAPIDHQTVIRLNRDTLIGFLISEFEIAEFCHRACNGEWDDAMGHDEAEEQGFHVW